MRMFVFSFLCLQLAACASVEMITQAPGTVTPGSVVTEHKYITTYTIGIPAQAFVGEQMLHSQDYYVTTRQAETNSASLVASESFTMSIPPLMSVSIGAGEAVTLVGKTDSSGKSYRVVRLQAPIASKLLFLIKDDGAFEGSALGLGNSRMGWTYTPKPESIRLVSPAGSPPIVSVDTSKGYVNYEILYNGSTRDAFQLLYREFTKEDLVRPAFTQTLVYEKGSERIRFRKLHIAVLEASSEKIRFTVLDDGTK